MKRFLGSIICAVLLLSLLTGCGATAANQSYTGAASAPAQGTQQTEDTTQEDTVVQQGDSTSGIVLDAPQNTTQRKIIWHVDMEAETLAFDELLTKLQTAVTDADGYLESSSSSGSSIHSNSNRYSSMTMRIPSQKLDAFVSQVGELANVTYTNKTSEDVTLDYVDIESRIATLKLEQERLLALLEKATDLDSIIKLESRLSEVRYQLESYQSSKNRYDSLIDYSTVTLSIREVQRVSSVHDESIGQRIAAGWSDTIYSIRTGCADFFVWFVVNLPFLLIWAVVIGAVVFFTVRAAKKKQKSRPVTPSSPSYIPPMNQKNPPEK